MKNTENSKEKKLKPYQKIAIERIYKLFELTQETKNKELKKRYLSLATKIGKKCEVSIPKELKNKYCKKCLSTNVEVKKQKPFIIITCKECGFVKKLGTKE